MTERQQLPRRRSGRRARSGTPGVALRPHDTLPAELLGPPQEASLLGLPAEFEEDGPGPDVPAGHPGEDDHLLVLRRPDAVAGGLLLTAAAAGGMALLLPWVRHDGALGLSLVRAGVDLAGSGIRPLLGSGLLLPLGVAAAAAVLFLLGLLAFRRARTHRATGTVALFVVLAVASGLLVTAAGAGGTAVLTDPGTVCAVLLALLGLLGALKAMLTVPEVLTVPEAVTDPEVTTDPGAAVDAG